MNDNLIKTTEILSISKEYNLDYNLDKIYLNIKKNKIKNYGDNNIKKYKESEIRQFFENEKKY